jgi:hypothetical protein
MGFTSQEYRSGRMDASRSDDFSRYCVVTTKVVTTWAIF